MRVLGNLLWAICGGLLSALSWVLAGLVLCITIIGIPLGKQCFKLAGLSLNPFGKKVTYEGEKFSATLGNIIWILLFGWEMALSNLICGLILYITIIGIPFGKQFFKLASVSLFPFGATIEQEHVL
jgi:uncharacterized membrane protein YccF (DUF307 family)